MGANIPDYRGLFLRGHGSQAYAQNNGSSVGVTPTTHQSGQLGQVQGDATRAVTGFFQGRHNEVRGGSGAVAPTGGEVGITAGTLGWGWNAYDFNSARVVPTASENRPVNSAVRYLIRALP